MSESAWIACGLIAQACFTLRFLVQWLASEQKGESVVPVSFWYFSLFGSLGLLAYAIHRWDPVFVLGQSTGFVIYIRNLVLISKKKNQTASS